MSKFQEYLEKVQEKIYTMDDLEKMFPCGPKDEYNIMVQDFDDPTDSGITKHLKVIYKKTGETNKFGRKLQHRHRWFEAVDEGKYIETTDKYKI
jgi:hypothetical protein